MKRTEQTDNIDLVTIPEVVELIDMQGKLIEKGVEESEGKVNLWQLPDSLSGGKFGNEVVQDLDLKNPTRELIHKGRVLRQPEGTIGGSWSELHALLFNNFCKFHHLTDLFWSGPVSYTIFCISCLDKTWQVQNKLNVASSILYQSQSKLQGR